MHYNAHIGLFETLTLQHVIRVFVMCYNALWRVASEKVLPKPPYIHFLAKCVYT